MEASPLTQQARPTTFQPKIDTLYDDLFGQEDEEAIESVGFWREFFLLRANKQKLQQRLESFSSIELLHLQHETRKLFSEAVSALQSGQTPVDENALDTLTVFLTVTLSKRFTNPSADVIAVFAGIDEVDAVFGHFANALESNIRSGKTVNVRQKAVDTALAFVAGAYQTSLVSYFTHRDLFPAIIKYIQEVHIKAYTARAFLLLGLLANYNKFEFRNPYRLRLEDFINEMTITHIVQSVGSTFSASRNRYVVIQEDAAEGWALSRTLTSVGLGMLTPSRTPSPRPLPSATGDFGDLPDSDAAILLGTYDFAVANKLFCIKLMGATAEAKGEEAPFSAFLSSSSYLLHHAHRTSRATTYGLISLLILRILIEDISLCKHLCDPQSASFVRLCRQRQPFLPASPKPRLWIESILDILLDSINHNLRRHLDIQLYSAALGLIHRVLSYLTFTRTRLQYHWSLLWQTLISFLRFLSTYSIPLISQDPDFITVLKPLLETLALSVTSGETFLPDASSYDDLFYKLVEAGETLNKLKQALSRTPTGTVPSGNATASLDLLIQVSAHYYDIVLAERQSGRLGNNPSPREVSKIIRKGYDSLTLPSLEGLDRWDAYREGEERGMLKRAARIAVDDTRSQFRRSS